MMTPEQWNGLVALMRAIAVASTDRFDVNRAHDSKQQAGKCEANVRKMFVDDTEGPMIGEQRHVGEAVEVFTVDGWKRIPIGALPPMPAGASASTDLDRLLLITADVCKFLDSVRSGHHGSLWRHRAEKLQTALELARVRVKRDPGVTIDDDRPESKKDVDRARLAGSAIVDERPIGTEAASIMVTLEHTVAAVLLAVYDDPRKAAGMLNEALVPGIERRLMDYLNKRTDQ